MILAENIYVLEALLAITSILSGINAEQDEDCCGASPPDKGEYLATARGGGWSQALV